MKIIEKKYRGSVVCRILGYPVTYAIVKLLLHHGPMELDDIMMRVKRAKSTVCGHLSRLRIANIVRYEKKKGKTYYWIKYPKEINEFLDRCEKLITRTTEKINSDY